MASKKRILLLDDDQMLRNSLAEQLEAEGDYVAVEAASLADARVRAKEGLYEFMILDVGLPDGDGRVLCAELREAGVTCPIIGPRTREQVRDHLGALEVTLTAEDLKKVDALNPPGNLCRDLASGPVPR